MMMAGAEKDKKHGDWVIEYSPWRNEPGDPVHYIWTVNRVYGNRPHFTCFNGPPTEKEAIAQAKAFCDELESLFKKYGVH